MYQLVYVSENSENALGDGSEIGAYFVQRGILPLRLAYANLNKHHNIVQLTIYLVIKFYLLSTKLGPQTVTSQTMIFSSKRLRAVVHGSLDQES